MWTFETSLPSRLLHQSDDFKTCTIFHNTSGDLIKTAFNVNSLPTLLYRTTSFPNGSKAFCFLILLLYPFVGWAQTNEVSGTIRDEKGTPLPGVNVLIETTTLGAATDVDGYYTIKNIPVGSHTMRVSAIGFRTQHIDIQVTEGYVADFDLVLREIAVQSGEVVVTAARRAQLSVEVPVSISALAPRELEARNIQSLDDALRYMPGVQLADNQVSVRGSSGFSYNTGSRVLLLVDGIPMLRPDADGIAFDAVPIAQIERIEVLKGPGSALYGGGALGGVINVITKDFPQDPETRITVFGGAYEPVRYAVWRHAWKDADTPRLLGGTSFTHARRFGEKAGMWINVAYRNNEGYMRLYERETLQAYSKVGWNFSPSLRLELLGGVTRRKSDSFLYWNGIRDALNPGTFEFGNTSATGANDNLTHEFSVHPSLTHVVNPSLFYTAKGRLFGVVIQPLDEFLKPIPASKGTTGLRYGGEVQVNWTPRSGQYLTAGFSGDANATRSSFFANDDPRSQPEGAIFGQWEQQLFPGINMTTGLRLDTYRIRAGDVERKLSPKLNFSFQMNEGMALRAAYGQGFRVPSVTERFTDNKDFFPVVANIYLRPEESTSYEAGLRGLYPFMSGRAGALIDVALFWNDYRHLVEPMFVAQEQAFQFVNLTKARIRGLEASIEARTPNEDYAFRVGYTYLDARDLSADLPLVFRSRHLVKTSLDALVYGPFEIGIDYRFASQPNRVDSDFSLFVRDAETLVDTHVVDIRLMADFDRFSVSFITNNAFEYYYLERPALLAPPRHYILRIQTNL